MSERKRGGPFPDSLEHLEAQRIGGYPTWKSWKYQVEERFGSEWKDGCPQAETLVHQFYILRRLQQSEKRIDQVKVNNFWQDAQTKIPDFEGKFGSVIEFIIGKTPIDGTPRKRH